MYLVMHIFLILVHPALTVMRPQSAMHHTAHCTLHTARCLPHNLNLRLETLPPLSFCLSPCVLRCNFFPSVHSFMASAARHSYDAVQRWSPTGNGAPLTHGESPQFGWDYAFVFDAPKTTTHTPSPTQKSTDAARTALLNDLTQAGFSYNQLWVPSSATIIVRVALPQPTMMQKAELAGLSLRVNSTYGAGFLAFSQQRVEIFENHHRTLCHLPYFTPAQRLLITQITLRSREHWGAAINVNQLYRDRVLRQAFALHARKERDPLVRAVLYHPVWATFRVFPLFALYQYLGSRLALYFAWLLFYTRMLVGFSIFAIPITLLIHFSKPTSLLRAFALLTFGVATTFWSMYWIRYWQRRNAILAVQWGLSVDNDDHANIIRDDFHGIESQGFYSSGGFVNLSDLSSSSSSSTQSPQSRQNSSIQRQHQSSSQSIHPVTSPFSDRLADYDDFDSDNSFDADRSVRLQAQHLTLSNLVRNEPPDWEQVVIVGGGGDNDLKLYAPVTDIKFDDLPVQRFCSRSLVRRRVALTTVISALFTFVVGVLSFCILFFRQELNVLLGLNKQSTVSTGVITAVFIIVSDAVWRFVSTELT